MCSSDLAASTHTADAVAPLKQDAQAKQGKSPVNPPDTSLPASDTNVPPPSSEWEFYHAGEKKVANDHLKPAPAAAAPASPKTIAASAKTPVQPANSGKAVAAGVAKGSYLLQVAAVRSEADAVSLAGELRKKRFPAFVQTPQGDKYYRVQVGPYNDQKAVQAAKKGLEASGFKAIIKR